MPRIGLLNVDAGDLLGLDASAPPWMIGHHFSFLGFYLE